MSAPSPEQLLQVAMILDPGAIWEGEPLNPYQQERRTRALATADQIAEALKPDPIDITQPLPPPPPGKVVTNG